MQSGGRGRHVAELIDELLAVRKSLVGMPMWTQGTRPAQERIAWPALIGSLPAGCELSATAYPNSDGLDFSVLLAVGSANIWRVDHALPHKVHTNPLFAPGNPLSGLSIFGPHFHPWADNRRYETCH